MCVFDVADIHNPQLLQICQDATDTFAIEFSPKNGTLLLGSYDDGCVRVYDLPKPIIVRWKLKELKIKERTTELTGIIANQPNRSE